MCEMSFVRMRGAEQGSIALRWFAIGEFFIGAQRIGRPSLE